MKKQAKIIILLIAIAPWISFAQEYPEPEKKDITLKVFKQNQIDYVGKVVEVEFTGLGNLKKISTNEYSMALQHFDGETHTYGVFVLFDAEAYEEFFEGLITKGGAASANAFTESVYIYYVEEAITNRKTVKRAYAIGTRHRNKNDVNIYSW